MNTKIKHTPLVIITEATLVILDLNLRRALLLYEDAVATAAPDRASLHEVIAQIVALWVTKGGAGFFGVCRCFFWYLH